MKIAVNPSLVVLGSNKNNSSGNQEVQLLLKKNGDSWCLPGCQLENGREAEESLKAMVNSGSICSFKQVHVYDRLEGGGHTLDMCYLALVGKADATLTGAESAWFDMDIKWGGNSDGAYVASVDVRGVNGKVELTEREQEMLACAVGKLIEGLYTTDDVLYLVSEPFILKDVQEVFEWLIKGKFLAFRRFIEPKVVETGEKIYGIGRPSMLYARKNNSKIVIDKM